MTNTKQSAARAQPARSIANGGTAPRAVPPSAAALNRSRRAGVAAVPTARFSWLRSQVALARGVARGLAETFSFLYEPRVNPPPGESRRLPPSASPRG